MASMWKAANRSFVLPALSVALCSQSLVGTRFGEKSSQTRCESSSSSSSSSSSKIEKLPPVPILHHGLGTGSVDKTSSNKLENLSPVPIHSHGFRKQDGDEYYHGLFPKRQLWHPKLEYPLWDKNWDGFEPRPTGDKEKDKEQHRKIRKEGITRHIILIRHGQYDETYKEDEKRLLTPLGRKQAEATGKRLAEMLNSGKAKHGPCKIKVVRVSDMARAKETADIIASYLPGVERSDSDPFLNEGRPCHHIPGVQADKKYVYATDHSHPRIEMAFQKLFHRSTEMAPPPAAKEENRSSDSDHPEQHEYEIVVCHANVIRYFLCRALQLPPEAWLRYCFFNCSLTYLTIRATGAVSCRMAGDIGHLSYDQTSFSRHRGFNW